MKEVLRRCLVNHLDDPLTVVSHRCERHLSVLEPCQLEVGESLDMAARFSSCFLCLRSAHARSSTQMSACGCSGCSIFSIHSTPRRYRAEVSSRFPCLCSTNVKVVMLVSMSGFSGPGSSSFSNNNNACLYSCSASS